MGTGDQRDAGNRGKEQRGVDNDAKIWSPEEKLYRRETEDEKPRQEVVGAMLIPDLLS